MSLRATFATLLGITARPSTVRWRLRQRAGVKLGAMQHLGDHGRQVRRGGQMGYRVDRATQLARLLDGIDFGRMGRPSHADAFIGAGTSRWCRCCSRESRRLDSPRRSGFAGTGSEHTWHALRATATTASRCALACAPARQDEGRPVGSQPSGSVSRLSGARRRAFLERPPPPG